MFNGIFKKKSSTEFKTFPRHIHIHLGGAHQIGKTYFLDELSKENHYKDFRFVKTSLKQFDRSYTRELEPTAYMKKQKAILEYLLELKDNYSKCSVIFDRCPVDVLGYTVATLSMNAMTTKNYKILIEMYEMCEDSMFRRDIGSHSILMTRPLSNPYTDNPDIPFYSEMYVQAVEDAILGARKQLVRRNIDFLTDKYIERFSLNAHTLGVRACDLDTRNSVYKNHLARILMEELIEAY